MKAILIFSLFSLCCAGLTAQSISREVVAAAGGEAATPALRVSWTAGEAIAGPLRGADLLVTQGFQQGELLMDPTAVSELARQWRIRAYPNPTAGFLQLDRSRATDKKRLVLSVYAADGRQVTREWRWPAGESLFRIELRELPPGSYFLQLSEEHRPGKAVVPFIKAR